MTGPTAEEETDLGAGPPAGRVRRALAAISPPEDPAARVILVNALVSSTGTGMFLTGSALFYTKVVGLSVGEMATGLAIAGAVGLIGTLPGGVLTDAVGARRMVVALHLTRAVCFALLAFSDSVVPFVVLLSVVALADSTGPAANEAMVADIFDRSQRVRRLALTHAARNVGMSIGAAVGALAVSAGTEWAFRGLVLLNAISFVIVAVSVSRLRRFEHRARPAAEEAPASADDPTARSRPSVPFVVLALCAGGLLLSDSVLFVALPLWIADHTEVATAVVGVVLVLNTILTAVIQVPATRLTDPFPRAVRALLPAATLMAVSVAVLGWSGSTGPVVGLVIVLVAAVGLTVAENVQSAASWQIRFDLAPEVGRAKFLSFFSFGEGLQSVYGPLAVTALAISLGRPGWLLLGGLMLVVAALVTVMSTVTARVTPPPQPQEG